MTIQPRDIWKAFAATLGDAVDALEWPGLELDDLDRAEGLRYLARLVENSVSAQLGSASARHPAFRLLSNGFGMDNPDNHYLGSPIDPRYDYRLTGTRGRLSYLSFAAQNQNYANAATISGGAGHLHGDELALDADGSFAITASRNERPGNWLRLADDSGLILVRQTRADARVEDWVDVDIECLENPEAPPPLDTERIADRLTRVALYAGGAAAWFVEWVRPWLDRPNTFALADPDEQQLLGGDPSIVAQSAYWSFGQDEALIVEVAPPRCVYWNIQLANVWAECLDTRRRVWRNNTNVVTDDDGVVRVVIAHRDPGHPNWLDTAGHRHGTAHVRYVLADSHPPVRTHLVPISEIPPPHVGSSDRLPERRRGQNT
jgi:Protein of unknown function (DUF1214)